MRWRMVCIWSSDFQGSQWPIRKQRTAPPKPLNCPHSDITEPTESEWLLRHLMFKLCLECLIGNMHLFLGKKSSPKLTLWPCSRPYLARTASWLFIKEAQSFLKSTVAAKNSMHCEPSIFMAKACSLWISGMFLCSR